MNTKYRFSLFAIVTIFVLVLSLLTPAIAFADDETPPPAPTEEPALPPAEEPASTEEESVLPPVDEPTDEPAPAEEEPTAAEVLEVLPEGTEIVVVNEAGEVEPLATEEAAAIIVSGDPMWCPTGVLPGGIGCTSSYTSLALLLSDLSTLNLGTGPGANGTIWIEDSYDSSVNDAAATNFTIDGSTLTTWAGNTLTIQGGWNGVSGSSTITGYSEFNVPLRVLNWGDHITLNHLIFDNVDTSFSPTGNGLEVSTGFITDADIVLNDIEATNNDWRGAEVNNNSTTGTVTIIDGTFSDNGSDGLYVYAFGAVSGDHIVANENWGGNGALFDNSSSLTLTSINGANSFNDNVYTGLKAYSGGNITLNDITATGNDDEDGVYLDNTGGSGGAVTINGTNDFSENHNYGLQIYTDGHISLNDVTANRNENESGARLDNLGGAGNVTLTGTNEFNRNEEYGLLVYSDGHISLNNVTAIRNQDESGAILDNSGGTGNVTLTGTSAFNNNDEYGLLVYSSGNISLNNVMANRNEDEAGAYLDNTSGTGNVTLTGTNEFNNNDSSYGLDITTNGSINLNSVTANRNGYTGAYLSSCGCSGIKDIILTGTNVFTNNSAYGLEAYSDGDITISNITANRNSNDGAFLEAGGNISLNGTNEFTNNDSAGLYAESEGDITLHNVTADYNYYNGAWLDNTSGSGNVSIYNSFFDMNVEDDDDAGLNVDSNGFVTLSGVSASDNGGDGANIGYQAGSSSGVLVENSVFNDNFGVYDNWGWGLYIDEGSGDVVINNVTASYNLYNGLYVNTSGNVTINASEFTNADDDDGVELDIDGNAVICNSTISDNDGYGLDADDVDGDLTLSDVTFSNNGSGPPGYTYGGSGTLTITSGINCIPVSGGGGGGGGGGGNKTGSIIPVTGGEGITCDGSLTNITVQLPNGDFVILPCPINEFGVVDQVFEGGLPGPVGDGNEFLSALSALVIRDGAPVDALEDPMVISFLIPDGMQAADLAILHWDGTQWVELEGHVSEDGLHFEVTTNFVGTFVLVTK